MFSILWKLFLDLYVVLFLLVRRMLTVCVDGMIRLSRGLFSMWLEEYLNTSFSYQCYPAICVNPRFGAVIIRVTIFFSRRRRRPIISQDLFLQS